MLPGRHPKAWCWPHSDTFAAWDWYGVVVVAAVVVAAAADLVHSAGRYLLPYRAFVNATNVCHVLHSRHSHMHYSLL